MDLYALLLLVGQLGHPSWEQRERATQALLALDDDALPLLQFATAAPDPEVRRRADALVGEILSVLPTGGGPLPWLDQLPVDYPERQQVIDRHLSPARQLFGWDGSYGDGGAPDWPEYRHATASLILELRRDGWPRWWVQGLLDEMVKRETDFRRKHLPSTPAEPEG